MRRIVTAILLVSLGIVAVLLYSRPLSAAENDFLIYFENSTLALKSQTIERTIYLPLQEITRHLGLASTDATGSQTYTIQGQNSRLVLTPGSGFISYNDQPILLQNAIRREGGQWLVPLDFLSHGLSRVAGLEFRYRPGSRRVFAGRVMTTELAMNAQSLGALTRLTLRAGSPLEVELQKEPSQRRAVVLLKAKAIDPARERLDYKDALVQSITFDDSEGMPRLTIAIADDVRDVRLTPSDGNRVYFVDFVREIVSEAGPAPAVAASSSSAPARANVTPGGSLRVIVIDAGHGGIESGAANASTLEKDLTLALARRLRAALQSRLSSTVILTRDSDVALTSEERVAVANNNQAGLFISLHTGFSQDKMATGSSIYIMKPDFTVGISEPAGGRLFLPWYMAYRLNAPASKAMADRLQSNLTQALPGWKFPIRYGPMGVLASATMPAIALEVGNLNNDVSAKTLTEPEFQTKFSATVAAGIEQFARGERK
jgi:N-acetylmuramoyl-L-alanine amidase